MSFHRSGATRIDLVRNSSPNSSFARFPLRMDLFCGPDGSDFEDAIGRNDIDSAPLCKGICPVGSSGPSVPFLSHPSHADRIENDDSGQ